MNLISFNGFIRINELKKMIKDNPNILTNKQNGIVRTCIRKLLSKEYNDIEKCIKKL